MYSSLYEINPRQEWTLAMDARFHVKPWEMEDLTPFELEAYQIGTQTAGQEPTPLG